MEHLHSSPYKSNLSQGNPLVTPSESTLFTTVLWDEGNVCCTNCSSLLEGMTVLYRVDFYKNFALQINCICDQSKIATDQCASATVPFTLI